MLFSDRTFDSNGGVANPVLPSYASSGSVVNVDGLLGLSYWFDTASKLTLGYRADYFKGSPAWNLTGARRTTPTASITGRWSGSAFRNKLRDARYLCAGVLRAHVGVSSCASSCA